MNTRLIAFLNMTFVALTLAALLAPAESPAWANPQDEQAQPAAATEDIAYMRDGRELHGKILSETRLLVVFEYIDPALQIKTKMTLLKENIIEIQRDVAVTDPQPQADTPSGPVTTPRTITAAPATRTYGTSRVQSAEAQVPSVYVVQFKGQLGTDIRADVYEPIVKDIRAQKPDVIVLEVECSDTSEMMFPEGYETPPVPPDIAERMRQREWGMLEFDEYRKLVSMFRDELRDIPQVVWIHDSDGISATVFMAWDKIYMSPNARLGSKKSYLEKTGAASWQDSDVRAKMIAAWMGIAKGFLEKGGYSNALAQAMLDPSYNLSCDWHGREVDWDLDDDGAYAVDTSDKNTTYFRAKTAEDFCLSQGTAEDIDDLALLLGYREYRLIEAGQKQQIEGYIDGWRRAFKDTQKLFDDYRQHMGWANGGEALKYLSRAKSDLERIIAAMKRYKAVELRWAQDFGLDIVTLEIMVEQMKEQIQALKRQDGGLAGGGGRTTNQPGRGGQ